MSSIRNSASQAVLSGMQLTLHATRRTPHGASRLAQATFAWSAKPRHAPSRQCRDAGVCVHATTAMHEIEYISFNDYPPPPFHRRAPCIYRHQSKNPAFSSFVGWRRILQTCSCTLPRRATKGICCCFKIRSSFRKIKRPSRRGILTHHPMRRRLFLYSDRSHEVKTTTDKYSTGATGESSWKLSPQIQNTPKHIPIVRIQVSYEFGPNPVWV